MGAKISGRSKLKGLIFSRYRPTDRIEGYDQAPTHRDLYPVPICHN